MVWTYEMLIWNWRESSYILYMGEAQVPSAALHGTLGTVGSDPWAILVVVSNPKRSIPSLLDGNFQTKCSSFLFSCHEIVLIWNILFHSTKTSWKKRHWPLLLSLEMSQIAKHRALDLKLFNKHVQNPPDLILTGLKIIRKAEGNWRSVNFWLHTGVVFS